MKRFIKILDEHIDTYDRLRREILNNDHRSEHDYYILSSLDDKIEALYILRHKITTDLTLYKEVPLP